MYTINMDKQEHTQKVKEILKKYNLSTKKELNKYISTILQTNEIGAIIEEFDILNDILKLHYNYESKINTLEPLYFFTTRGGKYNTKYFGFVDKRYYKQHFFSYSSCLNYADIIKKNKIRAAFRNTINDQIKDFKNSFFSENVSRTCPKTGLVLYNNSDTHVDHDYESSMTFKNMVTNFTTLNNLDDKDLQTKCVDNIFVFQNTNITKLWQDYHSVNASIQCIHSSENLKHSR